MSNDILAENSRKNVFTSFFTSKNLAKAGIFSALAFLISLLEIPLFPSAPFLKFDFSNVFILIGGFYLGPIGGVLILTVKEILCLFKTSTYIGQIANLIMGLSFILLPLIVYYFKKGLKTVIITLFLATILQIIASLLCNRFITFPLYGLTSDAFFSAFWVIVLFNAIKGIAVSVVTILLYKRVKKLLDKVIK